MPDLHQSNHQFNWPQKLCRAYGTGVCPAASTDAPSRRLVPETLHKWVLYIMHLFAATTDSCTANRFDGAPKAKFLASPSRGQQTLRGHKLLIPSDG